MNNLDRINEYKMISAEVWQVFKKYAPDDANVETYCDDVHSLDRKYKNGDDRMYFFFQQLTKIYFNELVNMKESKNSRQS